MAKQKRSQTPSKSEDLWRIFAPELDNFKRYHDVGHKESMWNAILFCDFHGMLLPPWLYKALVSYAITQGAKEPGKMGRPVELPRNRLIVQDVDSYRKQKRPFGRKGKLRFLSRSEAFKLVQRDRAHMGEHLSISTIAGIYDRIRKK